jgi:hypothetical protein
LSDDRDPTQDPTKVNLTLEVSQGLPRLKGRTNHQGLDFDCELISHVRENLFMGGCVDDAVLPLKIRHVVSLYKWEQYRVHNGVKSFLVVEAYDAEVYKIVQELRPLVDWTKTRLALGPTLVHCQAGLNRSGLLCALVLREHFGLSSAEAIKLLRERRSPAVLCNDSFEEYLLKLDQVDEAIT